MTINASYKPHYVKAAVGQQVTQERQQLRDSVARPAKVRRAEFIRRNLKAEIAAGRCTVTHQNHFNKTTVTIIDLIHKGGNYYTAILADGRHMQSGEWEGELDVQWQPQPVKFWAPVVMPHPLDAELGTGREPAFTWQRHPAVVYYKPE